MKKPILPGLFLLLPWCLFSQTNIFPGLSGQELLDSVVANYKPGFTLSGSDGRDTLYSVIYREADSVYCVYTRWQAWLTPGQDPSQAVFAQDINLEHTYPRAKGMENHQGEFDMHHLFPSREDVNNARGNLPFAELDDAQVDNWYYFNETDFAQPVENIDAYSEVIFNNGFEPREDHKGNVARAMFYAYAMYRAEADAVDPNYFEEQRETLCGWHFLDPVDPLELDRTWLIAGYQDNKPNPFALDCTLAERSYCPGFSGCASSLHEPSEDIQWEIFPNPASGEVSLRWDAPGAGQTRIRILNSLGRVIHQTTLESLPGENLYQWSLPGVKGIFWAEIQTETDRSVKKLILN